MKKMIRPHKINY